MDIKDLKAQAYDTAVAIEELQRKMAQLNQQIEMANRVSDNTKEEVKPK